MYCYDLIGGGSVNLEEHYWIKNSTQVWQHIGQWSESSGDLDISKPNIWERRSDLRNVTLKDVLLNYHPLVFAKVDQATGSIVGIDGFIGQIWDILEEQLNFSTIHYLQKDGDFGAPDEDGNWNGIVRDLIDGLADVTTSTLAFTEERRKVIGMSLAIEVDKVTLLKKHHTGKQINTWAFIQIFMIPAWIGVIVTVVCLSLGLIILEAASGVKLKGNPDQKRFSMLGALSYTCGVLVQRGYDEISTPTIPSKLLWMTSGLSLFFIFAYYNAVLTTAMTEQSTPHHLKTFSDAVDLDFDVFAFSGGAEETLLKNSPPGSPLKTIWENKMKSNPESLIPWDTPLEDIKERLLSKDRIAMFGYFANNPRYSTDSETFEIMDLTDAILSQWGLAYPKDSELIPLFDYHLTKLRQLGILYKANQDW